MVPDNSMPWTPTGIRPAIRARLLQDWSTSYTPRPDYPDAPSLRPGPIFDLPRMQATRIFQMRLDKSYLLAHTNYMRPDPEYCPRCHEDFESTEHALLHCPARQHTRDQFPDDLDLASAWLTPDTLAIIGNFTTQTRTGYSSASPSKSPLSQTGSQPSTPSSL
jgi:hypothetical protein